MSLTGDGPREEGGYEEGPVDGTTDSAQDDAMNMAGDGTLDAAADRAGQQGADVKMEGGWDEQGMSVVVTKNWVSLVWFLIAQMCSRHHCVRANFAAMLGLWEWAFRFSEHQ